METALGHHEPRYAHLSASEIQRILREAQAVLSLRELATLIWLQLRATLDWDAVSAS